MRPCPWRIPDTRSPHSGCKRGPTIRIRIRSTSTTPCVPTRGRYPRALSRRSSPDPIPPGGVSRHPWSGTKDSSPRSCPSDAVRAPSRPDSVAYGISILAPSPKLYHKTCREVPGTRRQPRHFSRATPPLLLHPLGPVPSATYGNLAGETCSPLNNATRATIFQNNPPIMRRQVGRTSPQGNTTLSSGFAPFSIGTRAAVHSLTSSTPSSS